MVDIQSVFRDYDVNPSGSINRSIQNVSYKIVESADPLKKSNDIILRLGGVRISDVLDAPIIAKSMVEQAVLFADKYDPKQAMKVAQNKVAEMKVKHPYLFVMKEKSVQAVANKRRSGDKKAKALEIFESNRGKKASDIARLIQVELGITFANAYYYVSRVFK